MPARTGDVFIKDLNESLKSLKNVVIAGIGPIDVLRKNIKDQLPLPGFKNSLVLLDKELESLKNDIKEALALAGDCEKTFKLKEEMLLRIFKDKKQLDTAKKLDVELDGVIKKAQALEKEALKDQKEIEFEYAKLLKQVEQETKLVKEMDASEVEAKKIRDSLNVDVIKLPGMVDQMEGNLKQFKAGKLPKAPALIATTLKSFKAEVMQMGKDITTANSVSDSLEGFLKRLADPYDKNAEKATIDAKKVFTELEAVIKKAKPAHQECLKDINTWEKTLKEIS